MKDLHDECTQPETCMCANDNHQVKKKDFMDSVNDLIVELHDNAEKNEKIKLDRLEKYGKNELLEKLKTIDPYYFEKVILILLKKMLI
ncbi:hypothetical protein IIB79_09565 [candidate division KSB1 bacterium]|nr:hypothetical protein [candidate division KSB1 bacterium]